MTPDHIHHWNCKCHGCHRYDERPNDSDPSIIHAKRTTRSNFPAMRGEGSHNILRWENKIKKLTVCICNSRKYLGGRGEGGWYDGFETRDTVCHPLKNPNVHLIICLLSKSRISPLG